MPKRNHSRGKLLFRVVLNLTLFLALFSFASNAPILKQPPSSLVSAIGGGPTYDMVASDGGIFTFGNAPFEGSTGGMVLNKPIVGMASTPDGKGYWLVASDGGIFSFGDAQFYGSTGGMVLNKPIVGMASTPDGKGYWLVASDGGIFSFGDAQFYGSTGGMVLNKPIVGMAVDASGSGYWLVASDGGIFSFGNAQFRGSLGGTTLNAPIVGMTPILEAGADTSWPQCSSTGSPTYFPPLNTGAPTVIGVTDGSPFTNNPCLAGEFTQAQSIGGVISLYTVLGSPDFTNTADTNTGPEASCASAMPSTSTSELCQSYDWGYNAASSALSYSQQQGAKAPVWWLDVEIVNSDYSTTCPNGSLWGCNTPQNDQVIQGAIAYLSSQGIQVGIYSTWYQWGSIAGTLSPGLPLWIAGATSSTQAAAFCVAPNQVFGGGQPWLVQAPPPYSGTAFDGDYAC